MNKEEFLDVTRPDWWLVDPQADFELAELRDRLGEALGYSGERDWYTRPDRLEPLWQLVEQRFDLAEQLDRAEVPDDQKAWIESAIQAAAPAEPAAAAEAPAPSSGPDADPATPATPEAPKRSIFAKKDSDNAAGAEPVDVDELKSSVSDLLADDEIPLSAADVDKLAADPNFEAAYAQAKAALEAEMAAADADEDDDWDWPDDEDEGEEVLEGADS
jgi:hypothetical protein